MFTNTHLTNAMAREAMEYRVRDAESLRAGRAIRTLHAHDPRAPRRTLSLVRRAAHRLA